MLPVVIYERVENKQFPSPGILNVTEGRVHLSLCPSNYCYHTLFDNILHLLMVSLKVCNN